MASRKRGPGRLFGALFGLFLFANAACAATITFPQPADGDRRRYAFEFDLLRATLAASQDSRATPEDLRWSAQTMTQGSARLELAAGKLSVVHSVASSELDRQLTPIPFSLDTEDRLAERRS
ncbi:hypothetical protein [Paucibacter sp. Y2R2-4]|uniref:hypothetical protein n=1 Tax=Paucibacter sp. Y2R2-4 TaxID=2893553 RepID=UPI0021E47D81|nr:hypothetical protein [Paucibacter sp. Y2R2-4]MCV2351288.1 hypothetical protein [Paucibacter sp. Y2R2-4]